jgi:NTP pyrophosphatase (non-canonical NTP hydrolase)
MTNEEYQSQTHKTAVFPENIALPYIALGIGNEAGELQGVIKKILRGDYNDHPTAVLRQKIISEAGDVLWYLSELFTFYGITFGEVMENNLTKLETRVLTGTIKGSGESVGERIANGV